MVGCGTWICILTRATVAANARLAIVIADTRTETNTKAVRATTLTRFTAVGSAGVLTDATATDASTQAFVGFRTW